MSLAGTSGFYRLACERCRGQKLRCSWADRRPDASCTRCAKAGAVCKTNYSRRVGRPPRSNASSTSQQQQWSMPTSSPPTSSTSAPPAAEAEVFHRRQQRAPDEYGSLLQQRVPQDPCNSEAADTSDILGLDSMSSRISLIALEKAHATHAGHDSSHPINSLAMGALPMSDNEDESRWVDYVNLDTATSSELPAARSFSLSSSTLSNEYPSTNFSFDLSTGGTEPSLPGYTHARISNSHIGSSSGSSMPSKDWRQELGKLGAALYEVPPAYPQQFVSQSGAWIMLVPKVVSYAKTLYRLTNLAASTYKPPPPLAAPSSDHDYENRLASEQQLPIDRPTWLTLLSYYTRILQICRYTLANIHMTLKTDRPLFAALQLEDTMMTEDEPHLKVLLLLQVFSYRLNMIATALGLPKRHRIQGSASMLGDRAIDGESNSSISIGSAADWALRGDVVERSVFGRPGSQRENITAAFLAEYEIIAGLVSEH